MDKPNGEIHFILEDPPSPELSDCFKDSDLVEIKRLCRKEAEKTLLLIREE